MEKPKRSREDLLQLMSENNRKVKLYKLEPDEHGNYLLVLNNPHHRAWHESDDEYEVIDESKK